MTGAGGSIDLVETVRLRRPRRAVAAQCECLIPLSCKSSGRYCAAGDGASAPSLPALKTTEIAAPELLFEIPVGLNFPGTARPTARAAGNVPTIRDRCPDPAAGYAYKISSVVTPRSNRCCPPRPHGRQNRTIAPSKYIFLQRAKCTRRIPPSRGSCPSADSL